MNWIRNLSIPRKIVAISMIISASALLLASAVVITYDFFVARRDLRITTTMIARVLSENVQAALEFDDQSDAIDVLDSISTETSIVAACIYRADGLFASYVRSGNTGCPERPSRQEENVAYVLVSAPILVQKKEVGALQLRATLDPVYAALRTDLLAIAGMLSLSGVLAFALSARLHKIVSQPLRTLARTARHVSEKKDYSIRVSKQSSDEVGMLVDSFNEMLARIQARESELAQRNEELQRVNRLKDEFLATLSHELRTPLTAIHGWVNLLQSGRLDREKAAKAMEVIDRNVKAQVQLVNDLLNVSQIITGKLKIRPEWIDIGSVVRPAVDSIRPAAETKGVALLVDIRPEDGAIFADPERLQQVLWNLLTNAVKFTGKGGSIKMEVRCDDRGVQFSVKDTGEGIEPQFLPFLFERFTQADASTTRKHGGLGLGLAIARHIVESHGGTILAHSEGAGRGATFTVRLPTPSVLPSDPKQSVENLVSLEGLRVMVVEDDPDTREMIGEGLMQHGASVVLATSAREALQLLAAARSDVLVSDIGMPEMDGYELMERIRLGSILQNRDVPAVALTAFATEQDQKRSLQAGYQAHLAKPVAIDDLVRAVASVAGHAPHPN